MPTLVAYLSARNHADRPDRVPTCLAARKAIRGRKRQGNQQLTRAAAAQMCPSTANSGQALYRPSMPQADPEKQAGAARATPPEALYRKWRTWQMSDHCPLWIEVATDYADDYLQQLRA